MASPHEDASSIAGAFREARRQARALTAFPGDIPANLEAAYAVQDRAIQEWDDAVAGWKVGGIPLALRDRHGGADRLAGPIFSRSISWARRGEVVRYPVFEGGFAAVEAELVFRIGRDCPPGDCPAEKAADLVDAVFLGIETAGSPLATINDLGPCVIVSDFGNNHGLIVGPEVFGWREPGFGQTPVRTTIDGDLVGEGAPDSLAGGPLASLLFLLDNLARRGRGLRRGDLVSTGAVTGVHPAPAGSRSRVEIPGAAVIEVLAVRDNGHALA